MPEVKDIAACIRVIRLCIKNVLNNNTASLCISLPPATTEIYATATEDGGKVMTIT